MSVPSPGSLVKLARLQGEKAGPEEKEEEGSVCPLRARECFAGHRLSVLKLGQSRANWDKSVTLGKEGKRNHIPTERTSPSTPQMQTLRRGSLNGSGHPNKHFMAVSAPNYPALSLHPSSEARA